jgi:FdrA protein
MVVKSKVWPSLYNDSVMLMQIAAKVRSRDGIEEAAAFMGTEGNHALLREIGLATAEASPAGPSDLIFAVKAVDEATAEQGLAEAHALLVQPRTQEADGDDSEAPPKTLVSALRVMPGANLAVISVPGPFAKFEALRALRRGLHVFLFSDNVPVADEIALKRTALERGLLCMGPDCGTAYLSGQGLGFFNVVPKGRIGCIAASGTGLQAVASRICNLGEGISHGIGVGGRDLSAEVGGIMTLAAFDALAEDEATEVIVLISKPPHPEVMARIDRAIALTEKPVVVCCLGAASSEGSSSARATTLDQAADMAVAVARGEAQGGQYSTPVDDSFPHARDVLGTDESSPHGILGLFTGGTLAHEALLLLKEKLGSVGFNGGIGDNGIANQIIDLGDDAYTVGRPHPMIAPETRSEVIDKVADLSQFGILLFDLVLGRAAHADPAGALADAFVAARNRAAAKGRPLLGIASVVGTHGDPQDMGAQVEILRRAGIVVTPTNAEAAGLAARLVDREGANRIAGGSTQ